MTSHSKTLLSTSPTLIPSMLSFDCISLNCLPRRRAAPELAMEMHVKDDLHGVRQLSGSSCDSAMVCSQKLGSVRQGWECKQTSRARKQDGRLERKYRLIQTKMLPIPGLESGQLEGWLSLRLVQRLASDAGVAAGRKGKFLHLK